MTDPELLDREGYGRDPRLERKVLTFLGILALLGFLGFAASVVNAATARDTAAAEARRNGDLLRQLAEVEQSAAEEAVEHRERNEALHADLCRLIYNVIQTAPSLRDAGIQPCRPPVQPEPAPTPAPSPEAPR